MVENIERKLKIIVAVLVGVFAIFLFYNDASAATSYKLTKKDKIYYNSSGSLISSGSGGNFIVQHYFGNTAAYCLQWSKPTIDGSSYSEWNNSNIFTLEKKIIAGKIIELGESKYSSDEKAKHLYITEAVNSLFYPDLSGGKSFSSGSGKELLDSAKTWVKENVKTCSGTNTSGCFNSDNFNLSTSGSKNMISYKGSTTTFISKKIVLDGMLDSYGGNGTSYKITISSDKGGNIYMCTNSDGTGCTQTTTYELKNTAGKYEFYIKITNASENSKITIKATGSNSATYPYGVPYRYNSANQALMIKKEISRTRKVSVTASLKTPNVNEYSITAAKIDENGNDLDGSELHIYTASDENGSNKVDVANNKSSLSSSVSYKFSKAEGSALPKYFCMSEVSAPNGYIFGVEEKKMVCTSSSKLTSGGGTVCYKDGTEEVDAEYCETHTFYCKAGTGEITEDGNSCILDDSSKVVENSTDPICPEGTVFDGDANQCVPDGSVADLESTVSICEVGSYNSESKKCIQYSCSEDDYTYDSLNNTCKKVSEPTGCKNSSGEDKDLKYCIADSNSTYTKIDYNEGVIDFIKVNTKNSVAVSKTDVTGGNELDGASMKICTDKPDDSLNCTVATVTQTGECSDEALENNTCKNNEDGTKTISTQWISSITPKYWRGLEANKTYYLVEDVAPIGYTLATYTTFKIDDDGTVKSGETETVVSNNTVVLKDALTSISISKQDVATSKELSGATLKICTTGMNEDGEVELITNQEGTDCVIATLADGTDAKWISTDVAKEIVGLPSGIYYLVEEISPEGYDTAESILFQLKDNGTLVDKDGNSLANNKLEMKDKKIETVPTGGLQVVVILLILGSAVGIGGYFYFKGKSRFPKRKKKVKID